MSERNNVLSDAMLSRGFLSQLKTEADVSNFLKQHHSQVLEKKLEDEIDIHLGNEENSVAGYYSCNSRREKYTKEFQARYTEDVISIPHNRNGEFEPIVVPSKEVEDLPLEYLPYRCMPKR